MTCDCPHPGEDDHSCGWQRAFRAGLKTEDRVTAWCGCDCHYPAITEPAPRPTLFERIRRFFRS